MYFSTNLTLGIRTKDLHSMVRSRKPVIVPIECPHPKTMVPYCPQTESPTTATDWMVNIFWCFVYITVSNILMNLFHWVPDSCSIDRVIGTTWSPSITGEFSCRSTSIVDSQTIWLSCSFVKQYSSRGVSLSKSVRLKFYQQLIEPFRHTVTADDTVQQKGRKTRTTQRL